MDKDGWSKKAKVGMLTLGFVIGLYWMPYSFTVYVHSLVLQGYRLYFNLLVGLLVGVGCFIFLRITDNFTNLLKKIVDLTWNIYSYVGIIFLISSIDRFYKVDMKQVLEEMKDNYLYVYGPLMTGLLSVAAVRIAIACNAFFPNKR